MSDDEDEDEDDEKEKDGPEARPAKWPWVVAGVVLVVFVAVVLFQVFAPKPDVWTDDAYVRVHYTTVSPRVSGHVTEVRVEDTQVVLPGQLLMALDPAEFETAVASARAMLERDTAQLGVAGANVARQPALIVEQEASVASARARLGFAQTNQKRYGNLAATGAGTTQDRQQADTTAQQDRASLDAAQAALEATRVQMKVLQGQQSAQDAVVKSDQAMLRQAELNLSYTRVVAPIGGMVAQRGVQVGDNVMAGSPAMVLVPLEQIYIEANYREVDLAHVLHGQGVTIHVDAYDIDLDGVVAGVPAASGASFSPIPPNNATGNFTKIVQRLPVRIVLRPGQKLAALLRAGMSVETTIHTGLQDVVADQRQTDQRVTSP